MVRGENLIIHGYQMGQYAEAHTELVVKHPIRSMRDINQSPENLDRLTRAVKKVFPKDLEVGARTLTRSKMGRTQTVCSDDFDHFVVGWAVNRQVIPGEQAYVRHL